MVFDGVGVPPSSCTRLLCVPLADPVCHVGTWRFFVACSAGVDMPWLVVWSCCCAAVFDEHYVRFYQKNVRTVDAVGPGKIAYQVTLANSHNVNEDGLRAVVDLVGATVGDPLRLCFCVDSNAYDAWAGKPHIVLPGHLADRVLVYVVRIEPSPSQSHV
jgi:hypothetical protein